MTTNLPLKLEHLPNSLPIEGAVRIELVEGVPIFRASSLVQEQIEILLAKQKDSALNSEEEKELDGYEELDDYLSLVNRTMRNVLLLSVPRFIAMMIHLSLLCPWKIGKCCNNSTDTHI
ncbi:MAG: hypothetical protein ACHBN1_23535 [Heteroscytonema crispum UTEX LB 1556]